MRITTYYGSSEKTGRYIFKGVSSVHFGTELIEKLLIDGVNGKITRVDIDQFEKDDDI